MNDKPNLGFDVKTGGLITNTPRGGKKLVRRKGRKKLRYQKRK
jgi:hypothetical protein